MVEASAVPCNGEVLELADCSGSVSIGATPPGSLVTDSEPWSSIDATLEGFTAAGAKVNPPPPGFGTSIMVELGSFVWDWDELSLSGPVLDVKIEPLSLRGFKLGGGGGGGGGRKSFASIIASSDDEF